jgi:UDP-4-amino-4,6-dideoxy-N-acetyl-beta-L-altrosamine N-acetyltransferase
MEFLNTQMEFNLSAQEAWVESSFQRPDYYHWLILYHDRPVGHIQLAGIDVEMKSAEWGYFIGDESALGIGGHVPALFYSFCFKHLGLESLRVQCLHTNPKVIALHQAYGYQFDPERNFVLTKGSREFLSIGMTLSRIVFLSSRFGRHDMILPTEKWTANPFVNSKR